jgi:drug/metabolite transporter (DMT)-like permease
LSSPTTNAGVAAFFCSLSSVVCPMLEAATGKKIDRRSWIAVVMAVMGAACLELQGGDLPSLQDVALGFTQPLIFGMYLFRTHEAMKHHPNDAMDITAVQILVTAVASVAWVVLGTELPVTAVNAIPDAAQAVVQMTEAGIAQSADLGTWLREFASDPVNAAPAAAEAVVQAMQAEVDMAQSTDMGASLQDFAAKASPYLALGWMGAVSSAFVLAVETVVVTKLSSSETALMFSTEPIWAAGFGYLMLGDTVGGWELVGGLLAISACIVRSAPNPMELAPVKEMMEKMKI